MNELDTLRGLLRKALVSGRAERYLALIETNKGRREFLAALDHDVQWALKPNISPPADFGQALRLACYVYCRQAGFGMQVGSVSEALDQLATDDGWLIVTQDGRYAVYRPEADWNSEVRIEI